MNSQITRPDRAQFARKRLILYLSPYIVSVSMLRGSCAATDQPEELQMYGRSGAWPVAATEVEVSNPNSSEIGTDSGSCAG